jgi:Kef-type K+ transport system membrane component KefB
MGGVDISALVVLLVLVLAGIAGWVALALLPGRIARARNHPQADAINVCGWWGALTLGLLMPVAFIWAYARPPAAAMAEPSAPPWADAGPEARP